ncbi:MAG: hypothetical protein ACI92E_003126, partial [Oceanicoccus sp.]
ETTTHTVIANAVRQSHRVTVQAHKQIAMLTLTKTREKP